MFPKRGNQFPGTESDRVYATMISAALRRELGETHQAIKTVVRWTGASERTAKNWFAATRGPNGPHLLALTRRSDEVFQALLLLAGRRNALATMKLIDAQDRLKELLSLLCSITDESSPK